MRKTCVIRSESLTICSDRGVPCPRPRQDTAPAELVSKLKKDADAEKDEKKKTQMMNKLQNVQGRYVAFGDADAHLTRCMDAAVRLCLRTDAMHKAKSEALEETLSTLAEISSTTKPLLSLTYIDPQENKEYGLYKREQANLEQHARRPQGSIA